MNYTIKAHKRLSFLSSQINITVNQWADTFGKDILYHVIIAQSEDASIEPDDRADDAEQFSN